MIILFFCDFRHKEFHWVPMNAQFPTIEPSAQKRLHGLLSVGLSFTRTLVATVISFLQSCVPFSPLLPPMKRLAFSSSTQMWPRSQKVLPMVRMVSVASVPTFILISSQLYARAPPTMIRVWLRDSAFLLPWVRPL